MPVWYCSGTKTDGKRCNLALSFQRPPKHIPKCPFCNASPIKWVDKQPADSLPPLLDRLGAGWRCPDCKEWVTGAFHFCIPINNRAVVGGLVRPRAKYLPLIHEVHEVSKKYRRSSRRSSSRPELVKKHLYTLGHLHQWAPWLATRAVDWLSTTKNNKYNLFMKIEAAIRSHFTSGDSLIPISEFVKFSTGPVHKLQWRFEEGWTYLGRLWRNSNNAAKKKLVCNHKEGLNHEKGYAHVRYDLELALLCRLK